MISDVSALGPTAAAVIVVLAFLKYISDKDRSQERRDVTFAKMLKENTDAMRDVADATKKQAREAAERNGHLAELAMENQKVNLEHHKVLMDAVKNIDSQHITKQIVEEQKVVKG